MAPLDKIDFDTKSIDDAYCLIGSIVTENRKRS